MVLTKTEKIFLGHFMRLCNIKKLWKFGKDLKPSDRISSLLKVLEAFWKYSRWYLKYLSRLLEIMYPISQVLSLKYVSHDPASIVILKTEEVNVDSIPSSKKEIWRSVLKKSYFLQRNLFNRRNSENPIRVV